MIFLEKSLKIVTKTVLENRGFHLVAWLKRCCDHDQTSGITSMGMLSGSTSRVNGKTRLSFTILFLSSFLPRQVDGSD